MILLSMGISYRLLNKPEEALRNYQDSIAINEKIGQKRGVAAALNEMGGVQRTSGKPDAALASYNKALALLRDIGMKDETANTLTNLGAVYQDLGKFDQALEVYQAGLTNPARDRRPELRITVPGQYRQRLPGDGRHR